MRNFRAILGKVIYRLVAGVVFHIIWPFVIQDEVLKGAPFAFMGVLFFAGAWFSYLKSDGLVIFRRRRPDPKIHAMTDRLPVDDSTKKRLLDMDDSVAVAGDRTSAWAGIASNLLAGAILICASCFI